LNSEKSKSTVRRIQIMKDHVLIEILRYDSFEKGKFMKKALIAIQALLIFSIILVHLAHADLNNFLSDLNTQARTDITGFSSTLSNQFGVPMPQVQSIVKTVKHPADAFMCLQLSKMTGIQTEKVVQTYKSNNGKGWGVIAKELGIKPGSDDFHALKRGDFVFGVQEDKINKKQGKGKDKGHKK